MSQLENIGSAYQEALKALGEQVARAYREECSEFTVAAGLIQGNTLIAITVTFNHTGAECWVPGAGARMEKWLPPSRVGFRRPRGARCRPSMPSSSPYCSLLLYRENRELPGELPLVAELDDESERMHAKQFDLTVIITDTHFPLITPNLSHPNPAYHQPVHLLPCSGIFRNAVAATSSSPSHRPGVALRERHVRQCSYIEPVRWREEESSQAVRP